MFSNLSEVQKVLTEQLNLVTQFRRHRDWRAAADRVLHSTMYSDLFIRMGDGRMGVPEKNVFAFIKAADQEFIDEIIRTEDVAVVLRRGGSKTYGDDNG